MRLLTGTEEKARSRSATAMTQERGSSHQTVRMMVVTRQRNNESFQSATTNAAMKMAGKREKWTSFRTDADWSVTMYRWQAGTQEEKQQADLAFKEGALKTWMTLQC